MPNLTSVGVASGVPNSGTGTVSTIDALMALIGEVQASPTSLTALDRLKTIAAALAGTLTVASHAVTNAGTFAVQVSNANANGRATPSNSAPVVMNSMTYSAKAASSTAALFGATGASGDYLDGVLIIPATAAAGVVSITDGSGSAITIFAGGGTTALPTLAPFYVPIGAISSGGAGGWKITTGLNVSVIGIGNFT